MIGDPVNEAARLTELAKLEEGHVLASAIAVSGALDAEALCWDVGEVVEAGVDGADPIPERLQAGSGGGERIGVTVDPEHPKPRDPSEQDRRMAGAAEGGVYQPTLGHRGEGLHDLVDHHRTVGEHGIGVRAHGAGTDPPTRTAASAAAPVVELGPLIGSPSDHGRPTGCLPVWARWEAGGVGAFHRVIREAADERAVDRLDRAAGGSVLPREVGGCGGHGGARARGRSPPG